MYWRQWKPYVPVAKRRATAARAATQLAKKHGRALKPIVIEGRKIAQTFWGEAWCDSLENHSDFENRLPRGRTYVRNGSVIDLHIGRGRIEALVSGSEIYTAKVEISRLKPEHWRQLKSECAESIDSLLDLLAGRFSDGVMRRLTDPQRGLFPQPSEIKMSCSCPDWAGLCKHLAAVLYGVGARLDHEPHLLFLLRGVDHAELVSQAVSEGNLDSALSASAGALAGEDLGAMFGIDLDSAAASPPAKAKRGRSAVTTSSAPPVPSAAQADQAATPARRSAKRRVVTTVTVTRTRAVKKSGSGQAVAEATESTIERVTVNNGSFRRGGSPKKKAAVTKTKVTKRKVTVKKRKVTVKKTSITITL
jgi:uncharacterized Zn finger protein